MKNLLILFIVLMLISCKSSKIDSGRRQVMKSVTASIEFYLSSDRLSSEYVEEFNYMLGFMLTKGDSRFEIAGHTDSVGAKERNQALSQKRAEKIKKLLIEKGISPLRLDAIGYGESEPIASNKSSEGRRENRRIEIYLLQDN